MSISDLDACRVAMTAYARADVVGIGIDQNFRVTFERVDGLLMVGVQGSKAWRDWALDLLAIPLMDHETLETEKFGPVHGGALVGAMAVQQQVFDTINGEPYGFACHSLGSGVALVLAAIFGARGHLPSVLVGFGSMRVALEPLVAALAPIADLRLIVNGNDPVPQLPPTLLEARPYRRIGTSSRLDPVSCHYLANYWAALGGPPAAAPTTPGDPPP